MIEIINEYFVLHDSMQFCCYRFDEIDEGENFSIS